MKRRNVALWLIGLGIIALTCIALFSVIGVIGRTGSRLVDRWAPRTVVERNIARSVEDAIDQSLGGRFEPAPPGGFERVLPPEILEERVQRMEEGILAIEVLREDLRNDPSVRWTAPSYRYSFDLPALWPYIRSLVGGLVNLLAIVLIVVGVGLLLWQRSQPAEKMPTKS